MPRSAAESIATRFLDLDLCSTDLVEAWTADEHDSAARFSRALLACCRIGRYPSAVTRGRIVRLARGTGADLRAYRTALQTLRDIAKDLRVAA